MNAQGLALLKRHENFEAAVYICPAGKKTIGYGYNLEANPLKLSKTVIAGFCKKGICEGDAEKLLTDEVTRLKKILETKLVCWPELNEARQSVLLNMAYNLGIEGLLKFTDTLALLARGHYTAASTQMLNSTWSRQVKSRAIELALIMRTGALR